MIPLAIAVGLFALVLFAAAAYNRLITLRNRYRNAYAQIDVQLKRRFDLIPQLVETARGYLAHERETLEAVTAARAAAATANERAAAAPGEATAMAGLTAAEATLLGALGRFRAVVEGYPDLKADRTMARLMEELTSTENRVAFARQAYNDAVMLYETARQSFPAVLVAGPLGFAEAHYFRIEDDRERAAVRVALEGDRPGA
jgi:LemA protein